MHGFGARIGGCLPRCRLLHCEPGHPGANGLSEATQDNTVSCRRADQSDGLSISPGKDRLLLATSARYLSIGELAEPGVRLAGLDVNPRTNGPGRIDRA